jgi:hypothetical protein
LNPIPIVKKTINEAWQKTLIDLSVWIKSDLVKAMVYGGLGIEGIAQTNFYKFISSDDGLSQLGIDKSQPPKLLLAYEGSAFSTTVEMNSITLQFGDIAKLKVATPHPANNTGNLQIESWLDWIIDGLHVGRGYVPRKDIPPNTQKSIRLNSPLGGLMLSEGILGSVGEWDFPAEYSNYDAKWLDENSEKIKKVLMNKVVELLTNNLK